MRQILGLLCALALCSPLMAEDVYAIFNAKAVKDSDLMLASSGIVKDIFVDVGSEVKKGDVLLQLANDDLSAQIKSAEHQYLFAKRKYERYKRSGGAVDKNSLDQFYSEYRRLESDYNYQRTVFEKTRLKAPFDGVIASKDIELGDGVGANNTKLLRLVSKEVKLILEFDLKYAPKVKLGDKFDFRIDGNDVEMHASISKIYPTADSSTRKVKAEAMVQGVIPGTFGDGYIRTK